jgi:6-pyruvoyltetrahydropterin/6-carboxytetrahydropterin synthase
MVYDFGLMKQNMKDIIDGFDHAITIWSGDDKEYITDMKKHSARWVEVPLSPSAEQFSRIFFVLIDRLLKLTSTVNGEREVKLHSVIVHETATGYAEAFKEDAYSDIMGKIDLNEILFSLEIQNSWQDSKLFEKIKNGENFINPKSV